MRIAAHPSPQALEDELLDRIADAKSADPLTPVLIVVPSLGLAAHVARRLVERFGAVLGVEVLHHRALAQRILETAGLHVPRLASETILDTLFGRTVRAAPAGRLRDFVRDRPGGIAALRRALTDLREAGLEPAAVGRELRGRETEVAALYARWDESLRELADRGAFDGAGLARAALPHASAFAARFAAVFHHGAYDLIGVHVDLVRALDAGATTVFLLPTWPGEPEAGTNARRARAIGGEDVEVVALDRVAPARPPSFVHAQGARAELETSAREALAAVAAGVPPHEVAVIVRTFGPYAPAANALLDAEGPRWHTSFATPLRRNPAAAAGLRAIAAAEPGPPLSLAAHAAAFLEIARTAIGRGASEAAGARALERAIEGLGEVETLLCETRAVPREEALSLLDAHVDAAVALPDGADGGGIRLLDAMQARGLTFRHVWLAGMNAGEFPRVAREHPFLSDASRRAVTGATGRPLPLAADRDDEEHLLLATLHRAAREKLVVSWRRADEAGRPLVPSLALRDFARSAGLPATAAAAEAQARAVPAHTRSRLEAWARDPGLLRASEEILWVALASETGTDSGPAVVSRRAELAAGAALVAATDGFAPGGGLYDGRVGPQASRDRLAATAIERLGNCPLRFFFESVLRVEARRDPATPFDQDAGAVGTRVHDVLSRVYGTLGRERAFERLDLAARTSRALELLAAAWAASATEEDTARARRLPLLDGIETTRWIGLLERFVADDLARADRAALVLESIEREIEGPIPGGPQGLLVRGRLDRVLRGPDGSVVGDYKTGGDLAARVKAGAMLQGTSLQVPLYALLTGHPVELLGVGPRHVPKARDDSDPRFARFEGFGDPVLRQGFEETVRVLAGLALEGRFPIRPGDHCDFCDYASACRRRHPPTVLREANAPDTADARSCWEKSAKRPTLAAVRAGSRR